MRCTHNTVTMLDDVEVDITITFDYEPGRPAVWYLSNGDPGYPAEPAEIDVIRTVRSDTGEEIDIDTSNMQSELIAAAEDESERQYFERYDL